jgi:hypothetical protein
MRAVSAGEDAEVTKAIDDVSGLVGGRGARIAIVHEIETEKKAGAANVTKKRKRGLQRLQSSDPTRTDFASVLLEMLVVENVEDRETGGAGYRIAAEGREEFHAVDEGRGDFRSGDDGGERKSVADGLAEHYNVGNDVLRFESPKVSA